MIIPINNTLAFRSKKLDFLARVHTHMYFLQTLQLCLLRWLDRKLRSFAKKIRKIIRIWSKQSVKQFLKSTAKSRAHRKIADSRMFFEFLWSEIPCDHREGWIGCANYGALWIWCLMASLHCFVIWEQSVGLACQYSPGFLRFMWRNNTLNNTEPKTHLSRPRIVPILHTRHKTNPTPS